MRQSNATKLIEFDYPNQHDQVSRVDRVSQFNRDPTVCILINCIVNLNKDYATVKIT